MSLKNTLNVVGLVVQANPSQMESVIAALTAMQGVDVHTTTADGRIVATAIDTDEVMAIDQMAAMNRTPGIVSTMIAYHQMEHPEAEAVVPCCGSADPLHSCSSDPRTSDSRTSEQRA